MGLSYLIHTDHNLTNSTPLVWHRGEIELYWIARIVINPGFGVKMRSQLPIHGTIVMLSVYIDSVWVRLRLCTCSVGFEQKIDLSINQFCLLDLQSGDDRDMSIFMIFKKKQKPPYFHYSAPIRRLRGGVKIWGFLFFFGWDGS